MDQCGNHKDNKIKQGARKMKMKYWIFLAFIVVLVAAGLIFKTPSGGVNPIFFFGLIAVGWAFLWTTRVRK